MDKLAEATARAYDRLRVRHPAEFLKLVASEYGSSVTNPPRATRLGYSAPMREEPLVRAYRKCVCCEVSEREVEIEAVSMLCLFCQPCPRCGRSGTGCEDDPPICDRCPEGTCTPKANGRCSICDCAVDLVPSQLLEASPAEPENEPTPVETAHVDDEPGVADVNRPLQRYVAHDSEGKTHAFARADANGYALCGMIVYAGSRLATKATISCYKCRGKL